MGKTYFVLKIEAEVPEQQIPKVATDLAVILSRDLPLNPIRETIEQLENVLKEKFKKEAGIRRNNTISIVMGQADKLRPVIFSWEKSDKGYLFTVAELAIPKIKIDKKTVKNDLKSAHSLINNYLKKLRVDFRDIHIELNR